MVGLAYFTLVILAITGLLFNYLWGGKNDYHSIRKFHGG